MATNLGANFKNSKNLITHFSHPITNQSIYIFPDPSHMIKLVRNALGSVYHMNDFEKKFIDWNFLNKLVSEQELEGLHLGNKLRSRHLQWTRG